jgi:ribosomal protein L11 methyltransferase
MRNWPALRLRFTPTAQTDIAAARDLAAVALDDCLPTAVQESEHEWLVFFGSVEDRDRAAVALPAAAAGALQVDLLEVPDDDWAERSQRDLKPVVVGRVTLTPPWYAGDRTQARLAGDRPEASPSSDRPEDCPAITVVIQPSMGFGTGHHASTRLCTAILQSIDVTGKSVTDVGTGSGVLALVALALGARSVLAVDDDADAIEAARENLALNGVTGGIDLRVADFRALPARPADVVTANLTGGLLVRGAQALANAVAPGGSLIISGVLLDEEATVISALAPTLTLVDRRSEDEWVGARLTRR